ncbi:MAG: protoglobin domain-containing protein [Reyranella sp.]|uniref:protoglobin domain-containing protein n=1 Tax=Reyranella sp. TaxID=1929291 RepID=UPI002731CA08|nr:protoglobin domain-containing protein [Reyranella sp.]MDP1965570.1 protoglobin domain-containing protein [Reyranella sp.]MDP2374006.1 protoglobin domain-containing protein [Reyranella sp.]
MTIKSIPGYRLGDTTLPKSPLTMDDLAVLKASLLFGENDVMALRRAHDVVKDQVEAILDVWYGFVGSTPHLLAYFSDAKTTQPIGAYLDAVRKRFGQWILDTCRADYDVAWLAYQDEVGRRHHRSGKNKTDGVSAAPHIPMRHVLALVLPISVTMKPFLAKKGHSAAEVEEMHAAWTKATLLQAILWCRPYAKDGDF